MASTPYYGPDESASTIFLERTFMAGDFICGVGYGKHLSNLLYLEFSHELDS